MSLADMKGDPWYYAKKAKRLYITPEDVGDAIKAGATEVLLLRTVLAAIERGAVEDTSCTAFVALTVKASPVRGEDRTTSAKPTEDK